MLLGENRNEYRQPFFTTWRKHQTGQALEPLEQQLLVIILEHPEYHYVLEDPETYQDYEYSALLEETNPFLHLGSHQAVREQVSVNLPKGITTIYKSLCEMLGDYHEAEHCIAYSLTIELNTAKKKHQPFNHKSYLKRLKKVLRDNGAWGKDL